MRRPALYCSCILILASFSIKEIFKVTAVSAGDTIKIIRNHLSLQIRLYGIDCPELAQPFGQKAKNFTTRACFNTEVRIVEHGKDSNGCILADVILSDGKNLSQELVRNGFAWHDKKLSSDSTLARLELEARTKKLGLWYDPSPVAPWEFRKLK